MLSSMELHKFLKRLGGLVNPEELKQSGLDLRRLIRIGLFGLAGLFVVLTLIFIVWPIVSSRLKKPEPPKTKKEIYTGELTYKLENSSDKDWKNVKLRIDTYGQTIEGVENAVLEDWRVSTGSSYFVFGIGDMANGQSKDIKLSVKTREPDEYDFKLIFREDATGAVVHEKVVTKVIK